MDHANTSEFFTGGAADDVDAPARYAGLFTYRGGGTDTDIRWELRGLA